MRHGSAGCSRRVSLLTSRSRLPDRCSGQTELPSPVIRPGSGFFKRLGNPETGKLPRPGPRIVESVNGTASCRPTRRTPARMTLPPEGGWCFSINAKSWTAAESATIHRRRRRGIKRRRRLGKGPRTAEGANGTVSNRPTRPFPARTKRPQEGGYRSSSNVRSWTAVEPAIIDNKSGGESSRTFAPLTLLLIPLPRDTT